jgi:hypothetical protein
MKFLIATLLLGAPAQDLHPWASDRHPKDQARRHAEEATRSRHAYAVTQGGTMDGRNCRSPLGVGMSREGACEQTWESNRSVRMENVGDTDVVNPWLSNGRNTFRTVEEIVASAVTPDMTDAEKATALWFQRTQYRYHFTGASGEEEGDLVKVFNVYGYNSCGSDAMMLAGAWRQAGLKVAPARGVGHCISQVFYDGRWHLYDGDLKAVYLNRDNETVAGEQDVVRDHDLVKRTHTQGILLPETRGVQEAVAAIYGYEGEVGGHRDCYKRGSLKMVLRPGEALTWRWGHLRPPKYHGGNAGQLYPNMICNGLWEYRPDLAKDSWKKGALAADGVRSTPGGLMAEEGKTATIVWAMRAPYVIVGGRLVTEGQGAEFELSWDGKAWEKVSPNLDSSFAFTPGAPAARYGYHLRCRLAGPACLKSLAIVNDLQMAPLALPEMGVGRNEFVYTDASPGPRRVRITHEWVERSLSRPPAASAGPVSPPDQGEAEGTDVVFRWTPAADPDGDKVVDYHFELSNRPDLRWPLSMSFYKLISRTPDRGKAQFSLPAPGLLTADRRYYWRVRAKDEKGVWGPWSAIWSFTPRGPNFPVDLSVEHDPGRGSVTLRWKPNPTGRKPARYRVYGSDEKGFSVSDQPYPVQVGACKELASPFPANFVAETDAAELAAAGPGADPSRPYRTYYRIVAVDGQGRRSGPSDYVVAPRPLITSPPVGAAKVGTPYRYALAVNRSLGDLRLRHENGRDVASFWDIERPRFVLEKGPDWLSIHPETGVLTGTPAEPGTCDVEVAVTLFRVVRKVDPAVLQWGNEKVLSTSTEPVGQARQRFSIAIGR